jgi:hypothetical protein
MKLCADTVETWFSVYTHTHLKKLPDNDCAKMDSSTQELPVQALYIPYPKHLP